jgi:hypothetical protein
VPGRAGAVALVECKAGCTVTPAMAGAGVPVHAIARTTPNLNYFTAPPSSVSIGGVTG